MRICIFGAGAIGGHLAVRLALQGHELCVLARGAQLAAIRAQGLQLMHGEASSSARVKASDKTAELGPQDLVFVTVKATGLAQAALQMAPLIGPQTLAVFAQNGMTWWYPLGLAPGRYRLPALPVFALGERFGTLLRPEQVVPGIVYSANEVLSPGVVRNNSPQRNSLEVAALDPRAQAPVEALRRTLQEAGLSSAPVRDARAAMWLKLIVNASASSLSVASGNPAAMASDPALHEILLRIGSECIAVAEAHGYALSDQLDLAHWARQRAPHKPSMLQDYELGRAMEIGEIVLAPQAFARAAGIATPTLDAVAAIAVRLALDRGLYQAPPHASGTTH